MSESGPLRLEFEVAAAPAAAFELWTARIAAWWPPEHTLSGAPAAIVFEPHAGGRILELAGDGAVHVWGEVLRFEPPTRVCYRWHLFFDPSEATEVEVVFTARGSGTLVRLEQSGFERLGSAAAPRRLRTAEVWERLSARYASVAGAEPASPGRGETPDSL